MISPQLHPDSSTSRPSPPRREPFNEVMEHLTPPAEKPPLAVAGGPGPAPSRSAEAVVNGLWHCLLGGLAAGLGVSAALAVLVLLLALIG